MPITASLGALTYVKLSEGDDWRWYRAASGNVACIAIEPNKANLYIVSDYKSTPGANGTLYNFSQKIIQSNTEAPQLVWTRQFGSNLTTNFDSTARTCVYDSNANTLLMTCQQRYDTGSQVTRQQFNANISDNNIVNNQFYAIDVDNGNSGTQTYRDPTDMLLLANGEYVITGAAKFIYSNNSVKSYNFLSKYSANGNARTDRAIGNNILYSGDLPASFITLQNDNTICMGTTTVAAANSLQTNILNINANISSINWQKFLQYSNSTPIGTIKGLTSDGSNIYVSIDKSSYCALVKLDSTGNIIWQKHLTGNVFDTFDKLEINQSNSQQIIALGSFLVSNTPGPGNVRAQILSIDANNGDILWCNRLGTANIANIVVEGSNLYLCITEGSFYKVPSDGTVPGSGNYGGGYSQRPIPSSNTANIIVTANGNMINYQFLSTYISTNLSSNTSNIAISALRLVA